MNNTNSKQPHTPALLSTKLLTERQRNRLLHMGVSVRDYNAIEIRFREVIPPSGYTHFIFSSQNAVKAFLQVRNPAYPTPGALHCYCVGEETRRLLENNGFHVVQSARSARLLARRIIESARDKQFLFPCGNLRRDTIPFMLGEAGISVREVIAYDTLLNPQEFQEVFDAILFFSPSGVRSYYQANEGGSALALCIGPTTAAEVKKYTNRFMIADEPSISSVISLVNRMPARKRPEE